MRLTQLFELAPPAVEQRGTYAAVIFSEETIKALKELQEKLDVPNPVDESDFHTTLLFSRKHLPNYQPLGELSPVQTADDIDYRLELWPTSSESKTCCVLLFDSNWLSERHQTLMDEHGATYDFPTYTPHITLSYDVGDWKPEEMTVELNNQRVITMVEEYSEPLEL